MPRIDFIPRIIKSYVFFYCPKCKEELEIKYLAVQILYCHKCKICYELHLRKSRITEEKLIEDGWLKDD